MVKINKYKWIIAIMILIGMMIGMAISFTTEIIIFNRIEKEKITDTEMNITYGDLQKYAKGSHTMGERGY